MNLCNRCEGFVPAGSALCPNCHSSKRVWWRVPLAIAGAGMATVTLSACYGPPCVANSLPDGGENHGRGECGYDCNQKLSDGGERPRDKTWLEVCTDRPADAGAGDAGATDGGDGG